jgi:hypothetical protein
MFVSVVTFDGVNLGAIDIRRTDTERDVLEKVNQLAAGRGLVAEKVVVEGTALSPTTHVFVDKLTSSQGALQRIWVDVSDGSASATAERRRRAEADASIYAASTLRLALAAASTQRQTEDERRLREQAAQELLEDEEEGLFDEEEPNMVAVSFQAAMLNFEPLFVDRPRKVGEIKLMEGRHSGSNLHTQFANHLRGIGFLSLLSVQGRHGVIPILDRNDVFYKVRPYTFFYASVQGLPRGAARKGGRRRGSRKSIGVKLVQRRKRSLRSTRKNSRSRSLRRK